MKHTLVGLAAAALLLMPVIAQDLITIGRAEAAILQVYPEVTVIAMQRVEQDGAFVWEARLEDGTLIYVDARTADIIEVVPVSTEPVIGPRPTIVPPAQPTALSPAPVRGLPAISFQRAVEIAKAQYPDAELVAAGLESGRWDIQLSNGMAVYINARTGAIVQLEAWNGDRSPIEMPLISLEQALGIAQAFYPRRNFITIELERGGRREGFAVVWKISFGRDQEVYIDATTGAVLRTR